VSDAQIAQWYDFRWQIESFFKLLKQAGHQLERWEQESGSALFKRLLIATHACLLVWRLARERGEEARQTQAFLVRLSGHQMKASRPVTLSALLEGVFMLLALLETLEHHPRINSELSPAPSSTNCLTGDDMCRYLCLIRGGTERQTLGRHDNLIYPIALRPSPKRSSSSYCLRSKFQGSAHSGMNQTSMALPENTDHNLTRA
jgi:hypothetical protein